MYMEVNMNRRFNRISIIFYIIISAIFLSGFMQAPGIAKAAVTTLSAPASVKATSSSYNSIAISWSSVSGARGYKVYRATSSTGTYAVIKTTTLRNYNNTGLTTGKTYYYKVRAYKTSGSSYLYGKYSTVKSAVAVPGTPASVKAASSSYNSITVSWGAVTGASGYKIYRATSSTGSYSAVKTTTLNSYANTGLTTGTTYYYKVRAYKTVNSRIVYGSYSSIVYSKPALSKPASVKAVASSDGVININWSAITGADGYMVYKATSGSGTYELLATVSATNSSDTGLTAGTTCYYKVKAYRVIGSSTVYSSYSSVVSATIPVVHVTSVSLNIRSDTLVLGNSDQLTASITPENAANQSVTWKSSDTAVITVDKMGNITSVGSGTAIVTVTTVDGSKQAQCSVTVNNAAIKGIDVSRYQGTIQWASVKNAGIQFAMIRSSFGSSDVDPYFEANYAAAKANGIAVGAYHYSYATTAAKATEEVNFLISTLAGKQFEYPICVDIEDDCMKTLDKKTLTDIALIYLNGLKKAGYYPMIYTNRSWFSDHLDDTKLTGYDHWLAEWKTSYTYSGKVGIWQYSKTGSVSGISGDVDLDISYVDYAARTKFLGLNGF